MIILVVDDSETSRIILKTILNHAGYADLLMAESARAALEILKVSTSEDGWPEVDLILMDIVMPEMTGIEAAKAIKADGRWRDIPIIMVTVRDEEDSLEEAFEAGAIDFISKPVSRIELRARVRSVLKMKEEMDHRKARERELESLTRKLDLLSRRDGLTGVHNRRSFDETLKLEWRRARRNKFHLAALMIDIDFFKKYNDTYGHRQGDQCLKTIAKTIQESLKRPGDFVARYGGEEFVVLLPGTEEKGAYKIGREIQAGLAGLAIVHQTSDVSDYVTVSIGVSSIVPDESNDPEMIITASDEALYEAKKSGRNRINIGTIT